MAGCVYAVTGPTSFFVGFAISEIIAQVSQITKEGLLMIKKALEMRSRSFVKRCKTRAIAFWEAHLPSRLSLLMSSCNPSEKERSSRLTTRSSRNRFVTPKAWQEKLAVPLFPLRGSV